MSGHEEQASNKKPPYIGDDSLIVDARAREIERQRAEEKEYQRTHDRKQLRFNFLLTLFTGLLFATSVISDILLWRNVSLTRETAAAAKSSADVARNTLEEIKKSGSDTHDLAVAAKSQADNSRSIAEATKAQAGSTKAVAERALEQARATNELAILTKQQLRISVRPWVGLTDEGNAIQTTPLTFDAAGDASLNYAITAKNFSASAAQNVMPVAGLLVTEDNNAINEKLERLCADNYVGQRDSGFILFPGKERVSVRAPTFYPRSAMVSSYTGKFEAWLIGCIGYRDQFDSLYKTRFIYWLVNPDGRPIEFDAIPNSSVQGEFIPWRTFFTDGSSTIPIGPTKH